MVSPILPQSPGLLLILGSQVTPQCLFQACPGEVKGEAQLGNQQVFHILMSSGKSHRPPTEPPFPWGC